jgi:hypothetical protein
MKLQDKRNAASKSHTNMSPEVNPAKIAPGNKIEQKYAELIRQ